jgi:two-component system sensor histidine kinase QseC
MALALPLLALSAGWAIHRGLLPLRRLGAALAQRQPQALEPLSATGAPAEVVPMVDALNALFARIARQRETERRFTADAAHELRTPIAAIRAQAQAALGETEAGARRHALLSTLEGCDRAARLVDQLLTLSRLEADAAPATQRVELVALARQVAADLAPRALAKRQALALEAPAVAWVQGNETLLAVLLRNLLDNAVRYSPAGARVELRLQAAPGGVDCTIEDSGPGLADAARARLGERFFRVGGSDESGSGLGWSIAERIAQVHGTRLQAGPSAALGGLAVSLRLPAAAAT